MSREDPRPETKGLSRHDAPRRASTVYHGHRDPTAPVGEECTVRVDGEPLDMRYDLLSASPSGFQWGYGGSGPAQLAVALLAHAYDEEFAAEHYQWFKRDVVSELHEDGWTLSKNEIEQFVAANEVSD